MSPGVLTTAEPHFHDPIRTISPEIPSSSMHPTPTQYPHFTYSFHAPWPDVVQGASDGRTSFKLESDSPPHSRLSSRRLSAPLYRSQDFSEDELRPELGPRAMARELKAHRDLDEEQSLLAARLHDLADDNAILQHLEGCLAHQAQDLKVSLCLSRRSKA